MFKMNSETLHGIISTLAKGARKARLGENYIFIRTLEDGRLSFYFNGKEISVEKKVEAHIEGEMEVATTLKEIDAKAKALPKDQEIIVEKVDNLLVFRWGKRSKISVNTVAETSPSLEIPEMVSEVQWAPGTLQGVANVMTPFTANPNSAHSKKNPSIAGPNFYKDGETGEVFVRATDGFRATTMRGSKIDWFDESISIESSQLLAVADIFPKDVQITVGRNKGKSLVIFSTPTTTATVRTLTGVFPPVEKMYRTNAKGKWIFDRLDLIELCRRVKTLSPQNPKVEFRIKSGHINAVVPNALEQSVGVIIEGEAEEFAINANYLEMAASLFRTDEVNLLVQGNDKAITVNIDDNDDIRAILSPVRINT